MHSFFCKRAFNTKYQKKFIHFGKSPSLVGKEVVAMVIVTNDVIGGLSLVHLI